MERQINVFVTDNLKLAMAMTAAGFAIRHGEQVLKDGRSLIICELDTEHNGIDARMLKSAFENKPIISRDGGVPTVELPAYVDEIIRTRGITQEEYVFLAFDAARSALHNRSTVLHAIGRNRPLVHKVIGDGTGRALIYRDGTPKDSLKRLIDNA
jgi:hypothetical protein